MSDRVWWCGICGTQAPTEAEADVCQAACQIVRTIEAQIAACRSRAQREVG